MIEKTEKEFYALYRPSTEPLPPVQNVVQTLQQQVPEASYGFWEAICLLHLFSWCAKIVNLINKTL